MKIFVVDGLADFLDSLSDLVLLHKAEPVPHCSEFTHIGCALAPSLHHAAIDLLHRARKVRLELFGEDLGIVESLVGVMQRMTCGRVR